MMRHVVVPLVCSAIILAMGGIAGGQSPAPSPSRVSVAGLGSVVTTVGFGKSGPGFRPEPRFPFPETRSSFGMGDAIYSYLVVEHPRLAANVQITVAGRWLRGQTEIHRFSQTYTGVAGYASQWAWNGLPDEKMSPGIYTIEWSLNGTVVGRGSFTITG
ncbi:MAG: hypothetical protein ACT4PY_10730 [Armatimonadota bacterium]